jgi:cyclopropane fatty-acyl-phospholipid synthase-like methyltransferase
MTTKSAVENYYNSTWKELEEKGLTKPNNRHYIILDYLKKHGLKNNSKALEIGCGIGTLSSLVGKHLKLGRLVAVDISPETIKLAQFKFKNQKNIQFEVSDMSNWENPEKFDIILLPDVLEHIPFDQYENLFRRLKKVSHDRTRILINIPHPSAIEYYQQNKPELLQIIDLPVHVDVLSKHVYEIGFMIDRIEPYSIDTDENNYQFIVLKNRKTFTNYNPTPKTKLFFQHWAYRLKAMFYS